MEQSTKVRGKTFLMIKTSFQNRLSQIATLNTLSVFRKYANKTNIWVSFCTGPLELLQYRSSYFLTGDRLVVRKQLLKWFSGRNPRTHILSVALTRTIKGRSHKVLQYLTSI